MGTKIRLKCYCIILYFYYLVAYERPTGTEFDKKLLIDYIAHEYILDAVAFYETDVKRLS